MQNDQPATVQQQQERAVAEVLGAGKRCSRYKLLRVSRDATLEDIRKSYRRLALVLHPDKNPTLGADEAFKRVSAAFDSLNNQQQPPASDSDHSSDSDGFSRRNGSARWRDDFDSRYDDCNWESFQAQQNFYFWKYESASPPHQSTRDFLYQCAVAAIVCGAFITLLVLGNLLLIQEASLGGQTGGGKKASLASAWGQLADFSRALATSSALVMQDSVGRILVKLGIRESESDRWRRERAAHRKRAKRERKSQHYYPGDLSGRGLH